MNERLNGLYAAIDRVASAGEEAAVMVLRRLIRTPSVSGEEGSAEDAGSVPGQLKSALESEAGVSVAIDTMAPGRDSVIGTLGSGPRVFALDAHTDTVPAGDPSHWHNADPFGAIDGAATYLGDRRLRLTVGDTVVEREIRPRLARMWEARGVETVPVIYGRGAFDNKAPVAVAMYATQILARALEESKLRLSGTLVSAFPVDEEVRMDGTRRIFAGSGSWLDRTGLLPAGREPNGMREGIAAVALDGSYGFIPVIGHRGTAQLLVSTHGQAAHAATPDLGVNAVTMMARVLARLEADRSRIDETLAMQFSDDILEPTTFALGTTIVGGGVQAVEASASGPVVRRGGINVVSDWCEATIDCRYPRRREGNDTDSPAVIAALLQTHIENALGLSHNRVTVTVLGGGPPCTSVDTMTNAAEDPVIASVLRHGRALSGFDPWIETAPGGTDATVMINEGKIRTLVEFGPAGAFSHEPHEFVERDQIAIGARILARTIVDWLGVEPAN